MSPACQVKPNRPVTPAHGRVQWETPQMEQELQILQQQIRVPRHAEKRQGVKTSLQQLFHVQRGHSDQQIDSRPG